MIARVMAVALLVSSVVAGCVAPWNDCDGPFGELPPDVQLERSGAGWRATSTVERTFDVGPEVDVELDILNGPIAIARGGDQAVLRIEAWGGGASADQARECLASLNLDVLSGSGVVAVTTGDHTGFSGGDRGVMVRLEVPEGTVLTGAADTSNGRIDVAGVEVRDFVLDTSNGPIRLIDVTADGLVADTSNGGVTGDLRIAGHLSVDTSNGPIDLALTPTASTDLEIDTSNGGVTLALAEGPDVAYRIDAETTNGDVASSMDEARVEGRDQDGTLVTENGGGRSIQVRGSVDTSNGDVEFRTL